MITIPMSLQPYTHMQQSALLKKSKACAGFVCSAEGNTEAVSPREDPHARSHGPAGWAEHGQSTRTARRFWLLEQGPAWTQCPLLGQPRQTGTYLPVLVTAVGAAGTVMAADLLATQPSSSCTSPTAAPHPKGGEKEVLATRKHLL